MQAHLRNACPGGGADVYGVSRFGHTDIGTTLRNYARFLRDVDERNVALIDHYFEEAGHHQAPGTS